MCDLYGWVMQKKGIADESATNARKISLKYGKDEFNEEVVSLIHKKGYGIVVWVINEPEDIVSVWNTHPDFIQTDKSDFKKLYPNGYVLSIGKVFKR